MNRWVYGVFSMMIIYVCASERGARAAPPASEICSSWFSSWGMASKASLQKEVSQARELRLDLRSRKEIEKRIDGVVNEALPYCARLDQLRIPVTTDQDSSAKNCLATFSRFQDLRDQAFTQAMIDRGLLDRIEDYAPAQRIHRREAAIAARLCRVLDVDGK